MCTRILVPLNGTGLAALAVARTLATATGASLSLLTVVPPRDAALDPQDTARRAAHRRLQQVAESLGGSGLHATIAVREGWPTEVIAACAREVGADLVCMATHAYVGVQRLVLGSVAEGVLRETTLPVLLVQAGIGPMARGGDAPVVVPLDGSPLAESALPGSVALARQLAAPLVLVRVREAFPSFFDEYRPLGPDLASRAPWEPDEAAIDAYLAAVRARLAYDDVRTVQLCGVPSAALVGYLRATHPRLVAMATHGRSGVARWILGSVAATVVHAAVAPVLLTRPVPPCNAAVGTDAAAPAAAIVPL